MSIPDVVYDYEFNTGLDGGTTPYTVSPRTFQKTQRLKQLSNIKFAIIVYVLLTMLRCLLREFLCQKSHI